MPDISPTLEARLREGGDLFCHLVEMQLNGINLFLTETDFNLDFNGNTYLGNGQLIDIDAVQQTGDVRINKTNIVFTAVDQTIIALMQQNNQINRQIKIYRAYLNDDYSIIDTPLLLTWGQITNFSTNSNNTSAEITLSIAGAFQDWERASNLRTTDASQKRWFPDDDGFEFANQIKPALKWGGK